MSVWLSHECPHVWSTLFWIFLLGCFWMRLTLEMVDQVKQIALPKAGGPHRISWKTKEIKSLTFPQLRQNSSCLTSFGARHELFPAFGLKLKHWLFLGLKAFLREPHHWLSWCSGLQTQTGTYTICSPGSPACWLTLQILGLVSFNNCVSQLLKIKISLSFSLSPLSSILLYQTAWRLCVDTYEASPTLDV